MYDKDLTIFSVFHKAYPSPTCSFIKPLQVGKPQNKLNLNFLSDDVGDNISNKNNRLSEATALYWIWKNLDSIKSDYIGLAHYRRYFCLPETKVKKTLWGEKIVFDNSDIFIKEPSESSLSKISSPNIKAYILAELNEKSIVMAKKSGLGTLGSYAFDVKNQFIYYHLKEDWEIFEDVLKQMHPSYYEFGRTFFSSANYMHCYNMFVADKKLINEYCLWLFPILFELEKQIQISPYNYQNRSIAFLSERLLNLYVYKHKLAISEMPIVYFT